MNLTDEQTMLMDSAARFLQDNYDFERRQSIAKDGGFDPAVWSAFAEMGWLSMPLPEAAGGFDCGPVEIMLLCEQIGRHLVLEPYLETVVVVGGLLQRGASAEYTDRFLTGIGEGGIQGALAHGEPNKHRSMANVQTTAEAVEGGYRLDGAKAVVRNGPAADVFLVSARTSESSGAATGVTLFAVPADTDGLSRRDYRTYDDRSACDLSLDGVVVPAQSVVGEVDRAEIIFDPVSEVAQLAACAEAMGAMDSLLRATLDYTSQRIQFGQTLSQFQVLRHRMVDMYIHTELVRSLLLATASKIDNAEADSARMISALKARAVKAGRFVAQSAVQLHGGIAMTDELSVGHYFKRLTMLESFFGNRDFHIQCFIETANTAPEGAAA